MNVTLIISSLSVGGAERVMASMANFWASRGWSITLFTLSDSAEDFYHLEPGVKRVSLNQLKPTRNLIDASFCNLKRVRSLRREIRQSSPDVIISFMNKTNVLTLLASTGLKIPIIISERTDPRNHNIGKAWSFLRKRVYGGASALVVQSEEVGEWAEECWSGLACRVIYNPVPIPPVSNSDRLLNPEFNWCVALGRLSQEKGFDLLINAFSILTNKGSCDNWRLIILGEGEERRSLECLTKELGLEGKVLMPGMIATPADYLFQADLFVMTSRYEGFPNALLEAMACGLPAVSVDCDTGPGHIIRHEVDGLLVPPADQSALVEGMQTLMHDEVLRRQYADRAIEVRERFSFDRFSGAWDELFAKYCN